MTALKGYLLSVCISSLLASFAQELLPKGSARRAASLIGSLIVMLAVMAPLVELDADTLAQSISELQLELETVRTGIAVTNRDIQAEIIKERCEAYILDKATAMGLTLEVEIQLSGDQTYPYPVGVTLRGQVSESERSTLSNMIAQELGIPEERQAWSTM